jgi:hypothetical protein
VSNTSSEDPTSQRAARRQKALLPGVIASLDGKSSFDCVIKDLSTAGARLTIPRSAKLQQPFYFINVRDRVVHRASVVWQSENNIGLRFHATLSLSTGLDPSLHFLNRLWLQRAVR